MRPIQASVRRDFLNPVDRSRWPRRLLIGLLIILVLFLLALVAHHLALGWARGKIAEIIEDASRRVGLTVRVDEIEVSLFSGVDIKGLSFQTNRSGRFEGRVEHIQFDVSLGAAWNRELPEVVRLAEVTTRADTQGVRALMAEADPGEAPGLRSGSREWPRFEIDRFDLAFQLDSTRGVTCHGTGLAASIAGSVGMTGLFDCRLPAHGVETGPLNLEASRDAQGERGGWRLNARPEGDIRIGSSALRLNRAVVDLGSASARIQLEGVGIAIPLPGDVLESPARLRLDGVQLTLANGDSGWRADSVDIGSGELRLSLPEPVEPRTEEEEGANGEEEEPVALEEAVDAEPEAVPVLIDWVGFDRELNGLLVRLDQFMSSGEEWADRVTLGGINLVIDRGSDTMAAILVESLTFAPGRISSTLVFADHRIDVGLVQTGRDRDGEDAGAPNPGVMLTWQALDVDLSRVSNAMGNPKLFGGFVDLSGQISAGAGLTFEARIDVPDLIFAHPAVSTMRLEVLPLHLDMDARFSPVAPNPVMLNLTGTLGSGVRGTASLVVSERNGTTQLDSDLHIDEVACRTLLEAIPEGMFIHFPRNSVRVEGRTGFDAHVRYRLGDHRSFRLSTPEEGGFPGTCEVTGLPEGYRPSALLRNSYVHQVPLQYAPEEIRVGPGTDDYWRLNALPDYVPAIMYLTEQRGFYEDPPVSASRISKAVRVNLIYGRWAYGGSTIAQQLVKNLFLDRGKTLARKVEEALIAWVMDLTVPRDRILELYINCIEFAPNAWGIEAGAQYYFGIHANQLSPMQAAWLAGLKPSPRSGERHRMRGHSPTTGRWPRRFRHHLQLLADRGLIDQDYVDSQAPYVIHFIDPDDPHAILEPYYRIEPLE